MYKKIFFLIFLVIFMQACSLKDSASYTSTREYKANEQKVFNVAKRMFESGGSNEYIVDTAWNDLVVSQREIVYLAFMIKTKKTYYELNAHALNEKDVLYSLRVSTQIDEDEKEYYSKNSFLHTMFWNQIEQTLQLDSSNKEE